MKQVGSTISYRKMRVIHCCDSNLTREETIFTEDLKTRAEDMFFMDSMHVSTDVVVHDMTLPVGFPLEEVLTKGSSL